MVANLATALAAEAADDGSKLFDAYAHFVTTFTTYENRTKSTAQLEMARASLFGERTAGSIVKRRLLEDGEARRH